METLQINKTAALKAFKEADSAGKKLLTNLFDGQLIPIKITDRVKTFDDACDVVGASASDVEVEGDSPDIESINAYSKLIVIAKALNEGWKPDWNNSNQRKWAPWFYMDSPGFRFDGSYFGISCTYATGGSRLCFSSEELANYAGNQFLSIYKDFLTIQ